MRRGTWIWVAVLVIVLAAGVGFGAYRAGLANGIADSGRSVEVVRVIGHPGFFGFGFLFFPLFFIALFLLFRAAFWRRWGGHHHGYGPGHGHHGPWSGDAPTPFEEWHRRAHGDAPPEPRPPDGPDSA